MGFKFNAFFNLKIILHIKSMANTFKDLAIFYSIDTINTHYMLLEEKSVFKLVICFFYEIV